MGKRSNFQRRKNDFYETPEAAIYPLLFHLQSNSRYCEPCAGKGKLVKILADYGHKCVFKSDINPAPRGQIWPIHDATKTNYIKYINVDCFITNPPWSRNLLHPIIENLSNQYPTWLLFDADWLHTKQSIPYLPRLRKIVSVGRVKWFPDSPHTGKDNCCWYLFDKPDETNLPIFIGRQNG